MKIGLGIGFLLVSSLSWAQQGTDATMLKTDNLRCEADFEQIKSDIVAMNDGLKNKDYAIILSKTYPALITLTGGKEAFQTLLKNNRINSDQQGMRTQKIEINKPLDNVIAGDEELCIIPTRLSIMTSKNLGEVNGSMIAIRSLNEQKWTYLNGAQTKNPTMLLTLLPEWPDNLILPEATVTLRQRP